METKKQLRISINLNAYREMNEHLTLLGKYVLALAGYESSLSMVEFAKGYEKAIETATMYATTPSE